MELETLISGNHFTEKNVEGVKVLESSKTLKVPKVSNSTCLDVKKQVNELDNPRNSSAYIPQCSDDGSWLPKQCTMQKTCWCVVSFGFKEGLECIFFENLEGKRITKMATSNFLSLKQIA